MFTFSVIIPHKNTPDLLQRCLDSIPRRDDVQIIVVDDNSDADKVDFEHFPGIDDERVEVYLTKEGKGAGYARNVGMSYAKGEWLIFADADDYFYTDNLSQLMDMDIPDEYDVVVWKSKYVYLDGSSMLVGANVCGKGMFVECDTPDDLIYKCCVPWSKMVRKRFVKDNSIIFDEVKYANDEMFSTKLGLNLSYYAGIDIEIYCHERLRDSLVETKTIENYICRLGVLLRKNKLLKLEGKELSNVVPMYRSIYFIGYMQFLRSFMMEKRMLGWRQTYYDYKRTCESLEIYKIPFLYKISAKRFFRYLLKCKGR